MTFADPRPWREALRKRGVAIVYHEIGNVPLSHLRDHRLFVAPALFAAQLASLNELGVQSQLQRDACGGMPGKVILTFDDASAGVFSAALPALARAKQRGVVFVVSDFVGKKSAWDAGTRHAVRRIMSREQLREWVAQGHAIGSHTLSHRRLTALSKSEAWKEVAESKTRLEEMFETPVTQFAYPYGAHDEQHAAMVAKAGYREAYTTQPGFLSEAASDFTIPRVPAFFPIRRWTNFVHAVLPPRVASHLAAVTPDKLCG